MNRKIRFLNLKFFKKENTKMPCFLSKLQGSQEATLFCFRFSKRFLVSLIKLLLFFHSCQIVIHLCLARKALFQSFTLGRLHQFFDQHTKQDNTLCSRVSSKNKENISLQSHLSLSLFLFKKYFRRLLKSGATEIEFKGSDF